MNKTLHQMIMDAELASAWALMRANDLREKGRSCHACGRGFLARKAGICFCPKCLKKP